MTNFNPLRRIADRLDARVEASEAAMADEGIDVIRTGRWSREYRLNPVVLMARAEEANRAAEDQHVREMALRSQRSLAIALAAQQQEGYGPPLEPRVQTLLETNPLAEPRPAPLTAYQVETDAELTALLDSALKPTGDGRGWHA